MGCMGSKIEDEPPARKKLTIGEAQWNHVAHGEPDGSTTVPEKNPADATDQSIDQDQPCED